MKGKTNYGTSHYIEDNFESLEAYFIDNIVMAAKNNFTNNPT